MANIVHWVKFWAARWLGDSKIRLLNSAERGVWISLFALAGECAKRGKIIIGNQRPTYEELGSLLCINPAEIRKIVEETLLPRSLISRSTVGVLYFKNWRKYQAGRKVTEDSKSALKNHPKVIEKSFKSAAEEKRREVDEKLDEDVQQEKEKGSNGNPKGDNFHPEPPSSNDSSNSKALLTTDDVIEYLSARVKIDSVAQVKFLQGVGAIDLKNGGGEALKRLIDKAALPTTENASAFIVDSVRRIVQEHRRR